MRRDKTSSGEQCSTMISTGGVRRAGAARSPPKRALKSQDVYSTIMQADRRGRGRHRHLDRDYVSVQLPKACIYAFVLNLQA
jgi:hypothetical protein